METIVSINFLIENEYHTDGTEYMIYIYMYMKMSSNCIVGLPACGVACVIVR
jgi:hypothetical protein